MSPADPRTERLREEDLFQIIDDGDGQICGVVLSVDALVRSFDQAVSICETLLQDIIHVHRLCDLEGWRYITTETAWELSRKNVSIHDHEGRCLAVDPTLDGRGRQWWRSAIGKNSYKQLLPEDRHQTRFFHNEALRGNANQFSYRAKLNGTYFEKTVRFEPFDSLSKRLLRVQHHTH